MGVRHILLVSGWANVIEGIKDFATKVIGLRVMLLSKHLLTFVHQLADYMQYSGKFGR